MTRNLPALALLTFCGLLFTLQNNTVAGDRPCATDRLEAIRQSLSSTASKPYAIHALRLGTSSRARRHLFIADPSLPKRISVSFAMWVIVGGGRRILVDTGFRNRRMVEKWHIETPRTPVEALADAGIDARDITDVVVTHGHWDHVGGIYQFGHANIFIHKQVFGKLNGSGPLRRFLRRVKTSGDLRITRDIHPIAPGVAAVYAGRHAPGFQYVVVRNPDGYWVLASDIAPLRANFERGIPTGQTDNPRQTLCIQQTMTALTDGRLDRIIPGHEPGIFEGNIDHVVLTAQEEAGGAAF